MTGMSVESAADTQCRVAGGHAAFPASSLPPNALICAFTYAFHLNFHLISTALHLLRAKMYGSQFPFKGENIFGYFPPMRDNLMHGCWQPLQQYPRAGIGASPPPPSSVR